MNREDAVEALEFARTHENFHVLYKVVEFMFGYLDGRGEFSGEPWQGNSLDPSNDGPVKP